MELIKVREVAEILQCHPSTVRYWSRKGLLPVVSDSGSNHAWLMDKKDVADLLRSGFRVQKKGGEYKACTKCQLLFSRDKFFRQKNGYSGMCKVCFREYAKLKMRGYRSAG